MTRPMRTWEEGSGLFDIRLFLPLRRSSGTIETTAGALRAHVKVSKVTEQKVILLGQYLFSSSCRSPAPSLQPSPPQTVAEICCCSALCRGALLWCHVTAVLHASQVQPHIYILLQDA